MKRVVEAVLDLKRCARLLCTKLKKLARLHQTIRRQPASHRLQRQGPRSVLACCRLEVKLRRARGKASAEPEVKLRRVKVNLRRWSRSLTSLLFDLLFFINEHL